MWDTGSRPQQTPQQTPQRQPYQDQNRAWDDAGALDALRTAGILAFGGIGFAAIKQPETEAFEHLLAAGPRVAPGVHALLTTATPQGKIYAAHLLAAFDPAYGRSVWQWLAGLPYQVTTGSGCVINPTTFAAYAGEQLARYG
jgi:hypothetical protein